MSVSSRRRNSLLLLSAAVFGYGGYKFYSNRRKISKLLKTLISIAEAVSSSAETITLVSSDVNRFLRLDSDEIPKSLKQISKFVRSDEFVGSVSRVSEGITVGIANGLRSNTVSSSKSNFTDRILDKLFSSTGCGFASVVVGSFAKNLAIGFYSNRSDQDSSLSWINLICGDEKCRELIANCIELFVRSAVAAYLEKTMEINTYDEFFAGVTNPNHETKAKELLVSVCNGAVETLIKTSHQVLNNLDSSSSAGSSANRVGFDEKESDRSGWVDQVSSTLAVPSNRRFVLDVTGRVTFETVRSFLDFVTWRLYDGAKSGVCAVREGVVERGVDAVRYLSAKSMLVVTICLALCMRVMAGTRVLMPA